MSLVIITSQRGKTRFTPLPFRFVVRGKVRVKGVRDSLSPRHKWVGFTTRLSTDLCHSDSPTLPDIFSSIQVQITFNTVFYLSRISNIPTAGRVKGRRKVSLNDLLNCLP